MTRSFKRTAIASAIIAITLGLTACGGGSSSSTTTSTSGTTSKGIINAGVVTAQELDLTAADPFAAPIALAETETGITGSYSLELPDSYAGGPILLTLTTDADSEMKCDVVGGCGARTDAIAGTDSNIDFGEWYVPGANAVVMQALIPAGSGTSISAGITPFTNMAVERAKQATTLDNDAINNANSEVATLLNIKADTLLATQPVDITDPASVSAAQDPEEVAYAAYAAAIANIAANNGQTLDEAITALADSFATGEMVIDDGGDTSTVSIRELVQEANDTLTEAGTTDTSGAIDEMEEDADTAEANGETTVNPEPTDTATASNIDKAKALIEDFRTYANALSTTVQNPDFASAFRGQVEAAAQVLTLEDADNPFHALNYVFNEIIALAIEAGTNAEQGTINVNINFADGGYVFTSGTLAVNGSVQENGNFSVTLDLTDADDSAGRVGNLSGEISGTLTENITNPEGDGDNTAEATYGVNITTGNLSGSLVTNQAELTLNQSTLTANGEFYMYSDYDDGTGVTTETYKDSINLSLDSGASLEVATGENTSVTFAGNIAVDLINNWVGSETYSSSTWNGDESHQAFLKTFSFDGSVTAGAESTEMGIEINMPNADDFSNPETAEGPEETASDYLQVNGSIDFAVTLAELENPVAVNLSAERTGLNSGATRLSLEHGDRSIVISGEGTLAEGADLNDTFENMFSEIDGDIKVNNADGVEVVINPPAEGSADTVVGTISVNDEEVGTIEDNDGVIKVTYVNGDIQLF